MVHHVHSDEEKRSAKEKKISKQREYLPKKVLETEAKKAFVYEFRNEYKGGDFDKILTEAEKSRLIYIIIDKIKMA